jgi:hypothetical protein
LWLQKIKIETCRRHRFLPKVQENPGLELVK